jgi:hypothetical protein
MARPVHSLHAFVPIGASDLRRDNAEYVPFYVKGRIPKTPLFVQYGRSSASDDRSPNLLRSYFLTNELFPRHALKGDPKEISLSFCGLFLDGVTNRQIRELPKSGVTDASYNL